MVAATGHIERWSMVVALLGGTVVVWQCWMTVKTAVVVAAVSRHSMLWPGVVVAAAALGVDRLQLMLLMLMRPPGVAQGSVCMWGCAPHPRRCGAS